MDDDEKKFIEDVSKSEYFDFLLEKKLEKKLGSIIRKYKWIASAISILLVLIAYLIGIKIDNISQQKAEIEVEFTSFRKEMNRLIGDVEIKRKEIQSLKSFFDMFKDINDRYTDLYNDKYQELEQTVINRVNQMERLAEENREIRKNTKENLQSMQEDISGSEINLKSKLEDWELEQTDWERERKELIKISSTVYAYIERGDDREPGTDEYRPEIVDLPFSDKSMRVTFNREESYITKNKENANEELIKEVEINITIYDKDNREIFQNPYVLREKHPTNIPNTEHQIEAQFIYLPPNPLFQRIPDFVILAISLRESAFEKIFQTKF